MVSEEFMSQAIEGANEKSNGHEVYTLSTYKLNLLIDITCNLISG